MKKEKFRYTEHEVAGTPSNVEGWVKLILTCVVVGPIRLVSEVTQKFLFLGTAIVKRVFIKAGAIGVIILIWNWFMWPMISRGIAGPWIPVPAMLISLALIGFLYMVCIRIAAFSLPVISGFVEEGEEEEEEEEIEEVLLPVFEGMKPVNIAFNESIDLFIEDPLELDDLGILPAVYTAAEDERLVGAIEKSGSIVTTPINLDGFLEGPGLGNKLNDNMAAIKKGLGAQLAMRNSQLGAALEMDLGG